MAKEIPFWKFNITNPNNTSFNNYHTPHLFAYFETSKGLAWLFKENSNVKICAKNLSFLEKSKSPIWRELEAIRHLPESSQNDLKYKTVKWYTDNYTCSIIAKSGSNKDILQVLAMIIFNSKI